MEHIFVCSDCGAKSSTQSKPWFINSGIHDDQDFCCDCFLDRMNMDVLSITFNHKLEQNDSKQGIHLELSLSAELSDADVAYVKAFAFNDTHDLQNEQLFDINVSGATSYKLNNSNGVSYYIEKFSSSNDVIGEFPLYCVDPPLKISAKVNSNYRTAEKIQFENDSKITYTVTSEDMQSYQNNSIKCTNCGESMFRKIAVSKYTEDFNTEYLCENCVETNIHVEINDITVSRLREIENSHYREETKYFDNSYDYVLEFAIHYSTHSKSRLIRIISMNLIEKEIVPYLQGTVTYPTHTEQVQPMASPFRNVLEYTDGGTGIHNIYVGVKEDFITFNLELQSPENKVMQYTINCNPTVQNSQLVLRL